MTVAYDQGDTRRLNVAFTDISGVAADPSAITFIIREPDGTLTTYVYVTDAELVKSSTGNYYVDWSIAQQGRHAIRWNGVGTIDASVESEFYALMKHAQ